MLLLCILCRCGNAVGNSESRVTGSYGLWLCNFFFFDFPSSSLSWLKLIIWYPNLPVENKWSSRSIKEGSHFKRIVGRAEIQQRRNPIVCTLRRRGEVPHVTARRPAAHADAAEEGGGGGENPRDSLLIKSGIYCPVTVRASQARQLSIKRNFLFQFSSDVNLLHLFSPAQIWFHCEFPTRFCWLVIYVFIVSINETGEYPGPRTSSPPGWRGTSDAAPRDPNGKLTDRGGVCVIWTGNRCKI